jgi:hypothetical protein
VSYLDLGRKFVKRDKYDPDELIALVVRGKLQAWTAVLENPASIIVAPANFGKTTEMEHRAKCLRDANEAAVFIALRNLASRRTLEDALTGENLQAYQEWKASKSQMLTLLVDSLDEAAAGKQESIEYLVSDIAKAVQWPNDHVRWVVSTRPAVLTSQVIDKLSNILAKAATVVRTTPKGKLGSKKAAQTSTSDVSAAGQAKPLQIYSMAPLDSRQADAYLRGKHSFLDSRQLLALARERGLSGFTKSPGGLDILKNIDLVSNPPDSLTEVFNRVVEAISVLRVSDHRTESLQHAFPELLTQAAQRLASASVVCQLINVEMPQATLEIPEKALSARLIATPTLNDAAIKQLLNSQLFIDVGFHQVKMYPDELLPFLAAQRLAGLVESADQALRLIQNFTWVAPSGEQGVHRALLPMMGWLASMNPHCRAVVLKYEPQALAFFGDLRSSSVPLADATEAMRECIRRVVEDGEAVGKGMYTLTSENYWQAGPERMTKVIAALFDEYKEHYWVRKVLLEVSATGRLDILRDKLLKHYENDYAKLLNDTNAVHYLLDLGKSEDLTCLATAIKSANAPRDGQVALLLGQLGWAYFTAFEVVDVIAQHFVTAQSSFNLRYEVEHGDFLPSATDTQLYQLCRGLVVRAARLHAKKARRSSRFSRTADQFGELTVKVVSVLVRRANAATADKAARLCLVLERLVYDGHIRDSDDDLRTALTENSSVRRALLKLVVKQSRLDTDEKLLHWVTGYRRACEYSAADIEEVNDPWLTRVYAEHLAQVKLPQIPLTPRKAPPVQQEKYKLDASSRKALQGKLPDLQDGSASYELAWVAQWLLRNDQSSRYGEVDFDRFESVAGEEISGAVRSGFGHIWRDKAPTYEEDNPRTTYHITVAGLQGLHLELGDGTNLPPLSADEVGQAVRYGTFEINGYPKWYIPLLSAHTSIATTVLAEIAADANKGAVSREHAEELFSSLADFPEPIRAAIVPHAWQYLLKNTPSREYLILQILNAVMDGSHAPKHEFEAIALTKMKGAFKSPMPLERDSALSSLQSEAVFWAAQWVQSFPSGFKSAIEKWGPRDAAAVQEFLMYLAAHFGYERAPLLTKVACNDNDVAVLGHLYEWIMWAVDPAADIQRPDGVVYSPGAREDAQDFRNALIGIIASADSQAAYDVLERLRLAAPVEKQIYLRRVQYELRERQFARKPLPQLKYDQFEKDFRAEVTDSLSFAMAVHSDLEAVKYDIERGEHSLRSFFSDLDFKQVNKKGDEGKNAALALEVHFQRLLASELNHHARDRYSVTLESHTAEGKRRDVLCSRNDWRASVELKMSARWTLDDYLVALERQLVGQYMRHNRATTGFLVIVLQTKGRTWKNTATGKNIDFIELLSILARKAQELEAKDRSRYLRVIGIDATTPEDFREVRKAAKKPVKPTKSATPVKSARPAKKARASNASSINRSKR